MSQRLTNGSRQEKSKAPKRAPGSVLPFLLVLFPAVKLKKLRRNECRLTPSWPSPPNMAVRSNPNSRSLYGLKLTFSMCTQGSPGLMTLNELGEGWASYAVLGMNV